jgi:predicted nucleotidyltransferase
MIAVSPKELDIILDIIKRHIPNCDVLAFGSRYKGNHEETSDLDLVVVGDGKVGCVVIGVNVNRKMRKSYKNKISKSYNEKVPFFIMI